MDHYADDLAAVIDALDLRTTDLVLDLGCGLGYSAAVLARMAQAVVAVEELRGMAAAATESEHLTRDRAALAGTCGCTTGPGGPRHPSSARRC